MAINQSLDRALKERQTAANQRHQTDPDGFELNGQVFTLLPSAPADWFLELEEVGHTPGAVRRALMRALDGDKQRKRFDKMLKSDSDIVDVEFLNALLSFVVELYTGRPLDTSTPSPEPSTPSTTESDSPAFSME